VTNRRLVRLSVMMAAIALTSCGSGSPAQPSTTRRATAFAILNGNTGFPEVILGPGDSLPIVGIADLGPMGTGLPVTDQIHLESSNPSVLRVERTNVIGLAPGEADIRATFQTLSATAHAKVFAPSAVSRLVIGGGAAQYSCAPNAQVDLLVVAILDDGTELRKMSVVWRSSTPTVARIDIYGRLTCTSPGQSSIDVTYQGRSASLQVTVRTSQITLGLRSAASSDRQ
jgi:hypothetical protein